ncbi:MAG TPA: SagB/ThcOx family dehydrogenase [Syntrophorhabdales bacterium]|nr:SagB/ThcOx family dehydrogenase [Syntrophorhabdales bacterium]
MTRCWLKTIALSVAVLLVCCWYAGGSSVYAQEKGATGAGIKLPPPSLDGTVSVEKALSERRSMRAYKPDALSMAEVSQMLWSAQGVTEPTKGFRTAPSPKGAYLLQVYLVAGNVTGLPAGLYAYRPKGHELLKVAEGDKKADLFKAVPQPAVNSAPASLIIAGMLERSTANPAWIYLEAGHAAENVYLQAVSLKLGTVSIAGFKPEDVKRALALPEKELPIYIMPLGKK